MIKFSNFLSIVAFALGFAAIMISVPATQVNSALGLLSLALFALGLLRVYSTLISSISAKRKRAYAKIQRRVVNRYEQN